MKMRTLPVLALVLLTTPALAAPAWSAQQAAGKPNVPEAGDNGAAWATLAENAGVEWLELRYARAVRVTGVRIFENLSPGAVTKISARVGDRYLDLWVAQEARAEGDGACPKAPSGARYSALSGGICVLDVEVARAHTTDTLRVWLDTRRVKGWNEIDAVELVGTEGGRVVEQWATSAWASSSYAAGSGPLAALVGARVKARLLNRDEVRGILRAVTAGVLEIEREGRLKWVPLSAIATVERD